MNRSDDLSTDPGTGHFPDPLMTLVRWIDRLNGVVGRGASWLTFLLVVVTVADVVLRYVFRTSFVAIQEIEWHLFAVIFLMAAGFTHLKRGHVRVDIVYSRLPARKQAWVDLIFAFFFLFPTCFLVIQASLPFVFHSWEVLEGSPNPGGLPARFLLKAVIPGGFFLLALQGISETIKNAALLLHRSPSPAGKN